MPIKYSEEVCEFAYKLRQGGASHKIIAAMIRKHWPEDHRDLAHTSVGSILNRIKKRRGEIVSRESSKISLCGPRFSVPAHCQHVEKRGI